MNVTATQLIPVCLNQICYLAPNYMLIMPYATPL